MTPATTGTEISQMLTIFKELMDEISKMDVDGRAKMMARHQIDKAMFEIKQPES